MRWFYDSAYDYGQGLPERPREVHGFVLDKPTRIRDALVASGAVEAATLESPESVTEQELLAVHDERLVAGLRRPQAVADAIELDLIALLPPEVVWSAVVAPQLHAAGGTCEALRAAWAGQWAINLSGGYHHARRGLSHGFCLVNDVALAIVRLRGAGTRRRVLIVDLDLHQGDGNADFFAGDEEVFTFSMHEDGIFPIPKLRSDLDVGLPFGAGDADYLARLTEALRTVESRFSPEVLVYLAGSDPYRADPLGSLLLSAEAMAERDLRVARSAVRLGCALVALPAGGYSPESPEITAAGFAKIAATADATSL